MSVLDDPMESAAFEAETQLHSLVSSSVELERLRRDNECRPWLIANREEIELTRDRLSLIIDDVRGL